MKYGYILRDFKETYSEKFCSAKYDKLLLADTKGKSLKETFIIALEQMSDGDMVVTNADQIATSINDLIEIYEKLNQKNIRLDFIGVDREQKENEWVLQFLKEIKTILYLTRRESILAGKQKAIKSGKKDGRPFTRENEEINHALELMKSKTIKEVSEITGIPYGTLRFYKRKEKENGGM